MAKKCKNITKNKSLKKKNEQEKWISFSYPYCIGFPQKFYNDNKLDKFKYAIVLWKERTKEFGVYFINKKADGYLKIVKNPKNDVKLAVKSISKKIYIGYRSHKDKAWWEGGDIFIFKLKKGEEKKVNIKGLDKTFLICYTYSRS